MPPSSVPSSRSAHKRTRRFALTALVALVLIVLAVLPAPAGLAAPDGPVVKIDTGLIRGVEVNGVEEFLGVPYAAPPVGDLRWRPPAPVAPWSGVRDAITLPEACSQLASVTLPRIENEDCLYLDIYRPRTAAKDGKLPPRKAGKLPVLFWIHNGGFTGIGAKQFDGSPLVTANGAIVVVPNWRQDLFGFLALPALTAEAADASSGNYGILDQQAALRWVQRNIAAFGGDPNNVTIFGQDTGGTSVCAHLASPTSAGLFRRASILNGECGASSLADAEGAGAALAESLGCADPANVAACMRGKSTAELLDASAAWIWSAASPNASGTLLPAQPFDAITSGAWNKVPVLLGSAHDGYSFILYYVGLYGLVDAGNYAEWVENFFGATAQVLAEYPLENYPTALLALNAAASDAWVACPTRNLANLFAAAVPTHAYEFAATGWQQNQTPAPEDFPFGAFLGAELPYLFPSFPHIGEFTPSQQRLSDQMIRYWGSFAAVGVPGAPHSVGWPRYSPKTEKVLQLREGGNAVITDFAADHHCAFWESLWGLEATRSRDLRIK